MSSSEGPVVFVPASGPRGSGEVFRCLALARAMRAQRPALPIHVVLDHRVGGEPDDAWTVHELPDTPARAVPETTAILHDLNPSLAVFDGSGRTTHLRMVHRAGGRVVWSANRPGRRRRGFSPRRLRWIDRHLLVGPGAGAAPPGVLERLLLRAFACRDPIRTGAIAPKPVPLPDSLDFEPDRPPAVFVAGGGGQWAGERRVPDLFFDAARAFRDRTGQSAWLVLGPRYDGSIGEGVIDGVRVITALPSAQLATLLDGSSLIVAGAGNMLSNQALLARRPCVMCAVGGHDQPDRLRRLAAAGAVRSVALDVDAIVDAAVGLVGDHRSGEMLVGNVERLGVINDTERVAACLLEMVPA